MLRKVEISHRTIIFTFLLLGLIWLLVQIKTIIIGLFVSLLLMTALNPAVDRLTNYKIPRGLAILIVYILVFGMIILGLSTMLSPLVDQTTNLVNRLPSFLDEVGAWFESIGLPGINGKMIADQISTLGALPANLVRFAMLLFSNIVAVITLLVITFYLLLERENLDKYLLVVFGKSREKQAKDLVDKLAARLGGWVRGELILMLTIGVLTYVGLFLLGVPYALPLAIIAGILEIIPNIGPMISAIPAILIGFTVSPFMGIATAALYFLIQQVENSVIVPKVMQKAVGVNPLITILALAIGFQLAGAVGAILSVPFVIVTHVVAVEVFGLEDIHFPPSNKR